MLFLQFVFIDTHDSQLCTLGEGFVVEEALTVLPHRAITRTNLKENHLALLLLAFINAGLLEVTSERFSLSSLTPTPPPFHPISPYQLCKLLSE